MWKYKIGIGFLFVLCLCTFQFVHAEEKQTPLSGKIIYLDPGHGGADPGAIYRDIHEAPINLKISEKIKFILEGYGATVFLTRYGDYDLSVPYAQNRKRSDLSRRGNIINSSKCDLYLSIHQNADNSSSWYGGQVFYDDINPENKKLAEIMQKAFKKNLHSPRTYKETDEMYLHKRIERPGVLVESGFLTNANERYLLTTDAYQQKIANTVVEGIMNYLGKQI